ncbi:TPA: hypothetical protein P0E36_005230 [Vibrio harveyi]|nr:hypothetical protein [Vibrio harveyi]
MKKRGLRVDDELTIAIGLMIVDKLTDQYDMKFPDALKVMGLVDSDWQEFSKQHYGGHGKFIRELLKFPVLWTND